MRLFGSDYFTLTVGGKTVFDKRQWRVRWNGWYNNFEQSFTPGKPVPLQLEWLPDGGLISLHHSDPEPAADKHSLRFASEAGTGLNYYFISGESMQGVIRGYQRVTGVPPMMPKWAYGFWQSRQRYKTQAELLGVLDTTARTAGRSTTSCRTGSTGPRTNGAATRLTRNASPTPRAWSMKCTASTRA